MKKYVFDTNVLVENPDLLKEYDLTEEQIYIPIIVLEELDKLKSGNDMLAFNARELIRYLESMGKQIDYPESDSRKGSNDNLILDCAYRLDAILVTNDKILKIKSWGRDVETEDPRVLSDLNSRLYSGIKEITTTKEQIDDFYQLNEIKLDGSFFENQYIILKGPLKQSAVGKFSRGRLIKIDNTLSDCQSYGIKPRNIEQLVAMDALMDPEIKIVSLVGLAGSGKTLLAIACALEQLMTKKDTPREYKKIIITRPIQVVGNDIGYLPGTMEEKLQPWLSPMYDNLDVLTNGDSLKTKMVNGWFEKDRIKIEAMPYIRGRSIADAFIILDEAQNISPHEVKTILTRVSEGTKIVLTGDIEQIDNPKLNKFSNGLTYMIEKMKEYSLSAHVSLTKSERSEVAELAAKVL